jgi:hypothetical protein
VWGIQRCICTEGFRSSLAPGNQSFIGIKTKGFTAAVKRAFEAFLGNRQEVKKAV